VSVALGAHVEQARGQGAQQTHERHNLDAHLEASAVVNARILVFGAPIDAKIRRIFDAKTRVLCARALFLLIAFTLPSRGSERMGNYPQESASERVRSFLHDGWQLSCSCEEEAS
jgi:hypothetical protein